MDGLLLDSERVCRDAFLRTVEDFDLTDRIDAVSVFLMCVGLRSDAGDAVIAEQIGPFMHAQDFSTHWDDRTKKAFALGVPAKAGAMDLLRQLYDAGIPAGVVTSTQTDRAHEHLDHIGALGLLQHVIGGDQVKVGKPDPEGYIAMAAKLGHLPKDCAAFEDSNTGIRAAVASGARAVQVPDLVDPTDEVRKLGHIIAKDLLSGAKQVQLID